MERFEVMDIDQAAEYLGIKRQTLYSWVFQRKIPFFKIGRLVKFDRKELNRWISAKRMEAG